MVGPAPDKQMPSRPGCVEGVIDEVTSGKPGIWKTALSVVDAIPESTDQSFSVRLMYSILHGFIYQVRIWWVLCKSRGQDGKPLKIEDLQKTTVRGRRRFDRKTYEILSRITLR